ncbi:MAG: (3R)-hydroxyacyl-ACP dehydratase subunit HadA, partial [uncultured Blastococcus sp.]
GAGPDAGRAQLPALCRLRGRAGQDRRVRHRGRCRRPGAPRRRCCPRRRAPRRHRPPDVRHRGQPRRGDGRAGGPRRGDRLHPGRARRAAVRPPPPDPGRGPAGRDDDHRRRPDRRRQRHADRAGRPGHRGRRAGVLGDVDARGPGGIV